MRPKEKDLGVKHSFYFKQKGTTGWFFFVFFSKLTVSETTEKKSLIFVHGM